MRNKGILYGMLVLFAVLALSVTSIDAEKQAIRAVIMPGTGALLETDDLAVPDGCEEIAYDDGRPENCIRYTNVHGEPGPCLAVHFTRPDDCERLRTARFYICLNESADSNSFNWSVLGWTGTEPESVGNPIASGTTDPAKTGWHEVDLGDIIIPKDFVIAMHWKQGYAPCLFTDNTCISNRSWSYAWTSEGFPWDAELEWNYLIRAIVCTNVTPDINVTPDEIDVELSPDESVDEPLTICNEGDSDLKYTISISYDTNGKATEELVGAITGVSLMRGTAVSEGVEIGYDDGEADDSTGGWLSVNKTSGTVAPEGECNEITVTIDATGLAPGEYSAEIIISSNDPDENPVTVPVSLNFSSVTTVAIESAEVIEGSSVTVPINITDVTDLCGADIWLSYDSSVVVVDDVSKGNLGPIAHNISNDAGVTKMAWDSTEGVTGDFALAYVTLTAVGSGGSVSPLNLAVNELYDSSLDDIGHNVVNGTFNVAIELMEGDANMDGCVSLKDSTAIKLNLVGRMDLNESQLKCADTLDDGEVNLKDSTFIRKWLVDPSTPLWKSPADDDMAKPVAC